MLFRSSYQKPVRLGSFFFGTEIWFYISLYTSVVWARSIRKFAFVYVTYVVYFEKFKFAVFFVDLMGWVGARRIANSFTFRDLNNLPNILNFFISFIFMHDIIKNIRMGFSFESAFNIASAYFLLRIFKYLLNRPM